VTVAAEIRGVDADSAPCYKEKMALELDLPFCRRHPPYFMVLNQLYGAPLVTVIHSLFRYSAGFGGRNALHGKVVGMLGETVGGQLPPLVRFQDDNVEDDFASALVLENVNVQPAAAVTAYFKQAQPH
jgi:hypothetical protein